MLTKSIRLLNVLKNARSLKNSISTGTISQATVAQAKSNEIPLPNLEGQSKEYASKIVNLVEEISKLNLIEVSDLNELLRKKLNIKDVAMNYAVAQNAAQSAPSQKVEQEQEEALPKATKSSFKLKLVKFDDTKKVGLIKEIKALGENMNLVQAKKFVESLPQVFKDNIGKEDAEKLKAQLEKAGAVCEIE